MKLLKKTLAIVLALGMFTTLSACGADEPPTTESQFLSTIINTADVTTGNIEINEEMRVAFNTYARENMFNYLPIFQNIDELALEEVKVYGNGLGGAAYPILKNNSFVNEKLFMDADDLDAKIADFYYSESGEYPTVKRETHNKLFTYENDEFTLWWKAV